MRVLVAIDGSDMSVRAVKAIAPWAAASRAEVELVTVLHPREVKATAAPRGFTHSLTPQGTASGQVIHAEEPLAVAAEDRSQALARTVAELEGQLRGIARDHLAGVAATFHVEAADSTAPAIIARARAVGADMIAMGTHGRTGVAGAVLGSVAQRVVRDSPVPVLLMGPGV